MENKNTAALLWFFVLLTNMALIDCYAFGTKVNQGAGAQQQQGAYGARPNAQPQQRTNYQQQQPAAGFARQPQQKFGQQQGSQWPQQGQQGNVGGGSEDNRPDQSGKDCPCPGKADKCVPNGDCQNQYTTCFGTGTATCPGNKVFKNEWADCATPEECAGGGAAPAQGFQGR